MSCDGFRHDGKIKIGRGKLSNRESMSLPVSFVKGSRSMEYIAEIHSLSSSFYTDYPSTNYPEISVKKGRPYSCLLIEYINDLIICIPFRSHVRHKYAYHFKNSARAKQCQSGLDYTKIILIKNSKYLDTTTAAVVDQDEYKETIQNLPRIVKEITDYIESYRDDLNGVLKLHHKEWQRRYGMSTLPYFDEFLRDTITEE